MIPQTKMQVPLFAGDGRIDWTTREVPKPGAGQLLMLIEANALCGSDRGQFYRGSEVTPGHEAVGVVVEAGPDTSAAAGTRGVIYAKDYCGACRFCRMNMTNQCAASRGVIGFSEHGGYDPYVLIHERMLFPIGSDIPAGEATLLLDIMGTGSRAINRARALHSDIRSVLVCGAGPIGLGLLAMAKLLLGDDVPVAVSDFVPYRLELVKQLKGIPIALQETTLGEGIAAAGMNGVDVVLDASGKESARRAGLALLRPGGVLVCVGHGEGLSFRAAEELINVEKAVIGSDYFSYGDLERNLALYRAHRDYLARIITHRFPADRLQEAYKLFFESGQTGKVVVEHAYEIRGQA
ncbi:alcohol dehydrogenase catalytic domain-containing protein [Paenibacillus rhizovicinus]|uniref:Alcohol dehydrogenase catalytic domain-containing protein n=1 Tax=Paenibacillus rhizovicinus TaxID=2704463 RepID=A0A6C0NTZ3_9BACL|nr:alcohol dehydrogenase catalytic domain-containing protein [Paenibacillus rhizovicinus]QHW29694.1 alcohol dehydrogenase catalytic domain-containing protein [Paenibacillus rhizovicinus]